MVTKEFKIYLFIVGRYFCFWWFFIFNIPVGRKKSTSFFFQKWPNYRIIFIDSYFNAFKELGTNSYYYLVFNIGIHALRYICSTLNEYHLNVDRNLILKESHASLMGCSDTDFRLLYQSTKVVFREQRTIFFEFEDTFVDAIMNQILNTINIW